LNNGKNLWIIKPSGLSRGRGIKVFSQLDEILHYIISSDCSFVAQKYIENSALILERRFDIRQWVVVTNFENLEFLFWDEFYVRLCSTPYSDKEEHLKDSFRHLANNSINKNVDQSLKNSTPYHNNIASLLQFKEYLEKQ
jgi:tubulin monoglycylase TTLL3/8